MPGAQGPELDLAGNEPGGARRRAHGTAGCGTSGPTSGLFGYVDGDPGGWVAGEPRENYSRIWARHPTEPPPGKTVIWDEASVRLLQVFLESG